MIIITKLNIKIGINLHHLRILTKQPSFHFVMIFICFVKTNVILARACGVPVGRRSGGRLATRLVATINVIIFFFSFLFSFLLPRLLFS